MTFTTPPNLPPRLLHRIEAVQKEDDAYAADELVELGEEILSQLAAMGMAVYLQQAKQKEVFNDFLISLFLSNGHAYNAGPLYRWAANMIKEAEGTDAELLKPFFWEVKDGKEVLITSIHHLASLRNSVMHGFFVLPPERNREETQKMEVILEQMSNAGLFDRMFASNHFIQDKGFTGTWNITNPMWWGLLSNTFPFGRKTERVSYEYQSQFWENQHAFAHETIAPVEEIQEPMHALLSQKKGAMVCFYSPNSPLGEQAYKTIVQWLDEAQFLPIHYVLSDDGVSYAMNFFERRLASELFDHTQKEAARKDPFKFLKNKDNRKFVKRQPVLVLHNLHVALFNPSHITQLFNACFEAELPVFCTSFYYPYVQRFFNAKLFLQDSNQAVRIEDIEYSLNNYLRFKGPNNEQADEQAAYLLIKEIVGKIHQLLDKKEPVVARHFADLHHYPMEYVHEAFSILSPFYTLGKKKFKEDEVDELYGFPKTIEESSRIFLTLGRRDVKLEYQHKVLLKEL
jgi:hypothetical protein